MDRREFTKNLFLILSSAQSPVLFSKSLNNAKRSDQILNIGIIGYGWVMKELHLEVVAKNPHCRITHLCEVDPNRLHEAKARVKSINPKLSPICTDNYEEVLGNSTVDAVIIGLPHHWHTLMAIKALKANKHIYLEKPGCLTMREYFLLTDLYQKSDRIVQIGTQNRSNNSHQEAINELHSGKLGKIKEGVCITNLQRADITNPVARDSAAPKGLNLELWFGPAPPKPIKRGNFHEDWYQFWDYGLGNPERTVHRLDLMNWAINNKGLSHEVINFASRVKPKVTDVSETPNLMFVGHKVGDFSFSNENRIFFDKEIKRIKKGIVIETDKGFFTMTNIFKTSFYDFGGKLIREFGPKIITENHKLHFENFIEAIKVDKRSRLNSDLLSSLPASGSSILENYSYLKGKELSFTEWSQELTKRQNISSDYLKMVHAKAAENPKYIKGQKVRLSNLSSQSFKGIAQDFPLDRNYQPKFNPFS